MASKDTTISSWNIASLRQRIPDLKDKIDSGNIDVIFSQECRIANDNRIPKRNSYVEYRLATQNSCVIYVKNTLPLPLLHHQSKHREHNPMVSEFMLGPRPSVSSVCMPEQIFLTLKNFHTVFSPSPRLWLVT